MALMQFFPILPWWDSGKLEFGNFGQNRKKLQIIAKIPIS
jgi:hypothetical protein